MNVEQAYGGVSTALNFFLELAKPFENVRLISYSQPSSQAQQRFSDYRLVPFGIDSDEKKQILSFEDVSEALLPIHSQDVFVGTYWATAYQAQRWIEWQAQEFAQTPKPLVYLIQDFEPGFFPLSSEYLVASSTYEQPDSTIAIFNTNLLKEYFHQQGYIFSHEFSFEPRINKKLYELRQNLCKKKKQILIYGRPSVSRNAFGLAADSLRAWANQYPQSSEWTIVSAGEAHQDIDLGNRSVLRSVGKLSLENYAKLLNESAVGISLMASPHPSYPPLEMSHYGMYVITNKFVNKDLSSCHENITSISICTPGNIAYQLAQACQKVETDSTLGWLGKSNLPSYFSNDPIFSFIHEIQQLIGAN